MIRPFLYELILRQSIVNLKQSRSSNLHRKSKKRTTGHLNANELETKLVLKPYKTIKDDHSVILTRDIALSNK